MTRFEFKEETEEMVYATACVGVATFPTSFSIDLFSRMWDNLTAAEQMSCTVLMEAMKADNQSRKGWRR